MEFATSRTKLGETSFKTAELAKRAGEEMTGEGEGGGRAGGQEFLNLTTRAGRAGANSKTAFYLQVFNIFKARRSKYIAFSPTEINHFSVT